MGAACSHDDDEVEYEARSTRQAGLPAGTPAAGGDVDRFMKQDPGNHQDAIKARKAQLGLEGSAVAEFLSAVEFISLGNYCAPANAIQALGLRNFAYPLDWVRSPTRGIIQLFRTEFKDFLTGTPTPSAEHGIGYHNTAWGGSFWHHDIKNAKVAGDFQRRIDRILGKGEVPKSTPRAFIRTINSTEELKQTFDLHRALQANFTAPVKLLTCIEFQTGEGPIGLQGDMGNDHLFYRISERYSWVNSLEERAEGYWAAIALASKLWAGETQMIPQVGSLDQVKNLCDPIEGGDPASTLFAPERGHTPKSAAPAAMPKSVPPIQKSAGKPTSTELMYEDSDDEDGPFACKCRELTGRRTRGFDVDDSEVYMDVNGFIRYVEEDL
mmetsp:Transcript_56003/g.103607  ORF Transcript_56003/g.103607 Transcript_56003/m.103607 type:complete len:382 (-) Transcript_56003:126-1271(-)